MGSFGVRTHKLHAWGNYELGIMNFELGLRDEGLWCVSGGSVLSSVLSSILPDATRCNGLRSALQWHMHRTGPFRPEVYA